MSTLLRLATAGSVDDGKSTLVGRLLFDSKSVLADQIESVERISKDRGLAAADLALLTDGLRAEREQGITIDVAYRYFATATRNFILADCPGHVQYTRNTVTGASTADVVVLLIDARKGLLEQTRRHLAVASLLRVAHIVVAINKIDLVDYSQARYEELDEEIRTAAQALGLSQIATIPVSALEGVNIVDPSPKTQWYTGPTLLEYLEGLPIGEDHDSKPFRFPVQTVIRPQSAAAQQFRDYRGYAGRIASGVIRVGDSVVIQPSGKSSRVEAIDFAGQELHEAFAPQSVTLRLADEIDITRGDMIVAAQDVPEVTTELDGTVAWLAQRPLVPGTRVLLKHGTTTSPAIVRDINGTLNLDTAALEPSDTLQLNDIGSVSIKLAQPIVAEEYARSQSTGSFLLIDAASGYTLAAGMVGNALQGSITPETRALQYAI